MRLSARFLAALAALLLAVRLSAADATAPVTAPATELERFIVTESALARSGDVLPTSRPVSSVFGPMSVLDLPRAVTVLTPELMRATGINDFGDLGRLGAGTQQINFYGVPGSPTLRGAKGGVFFDGMQRAWQRNEMPLSFGSLEAMDVVKGPAPAHFGAGMVGGYVNGIPKSPYFDALRGSAQIELAEHKRWRAQLDAGGPALLAGKPAAWRVSLTSQLADSYYDRVGHDYTSLYAALKIRVRPGVTILTGGEFFNFKSNENAGWNRPTQSLINSGDYLIGEPISIVSNVSGTADRALLFKNPALVVSAATVDAALLSGRITAGQRDAMLDLANAGERATAYAAFTAPQLASIQQSTSGYQYTPAYFAAGGTVFTQKIPGSTVLADERDYANSRDFLWFLTLDTDGAPDASFKGQALVDYVTTQKLSTYGYAIETEQLVAELKGTITQNLELLAGARVSYGTSARFTYAQILQDFAVEPFSRRDITQPAISANSTVLAGPQLAPDGLNNWSSRVGFGGANVQSQLWELSAFGFAETRVTPAFTVFTSLRGTYAPYATKYPREVDRATPATRASVTGDGAQAFLSAAVSPTLKVAGHTTLYATAQAGTSIDPTQGGAIFGKDNFTKNRLLEAGAKTALLNGKLFASLAAFHWRQQQFSALTSLAEPLAGRGIELEATWVPAPEFSLVASAGWQRVRREKPLGSRSVPLTDEQWALFGGIMNTPTSFTVSPAPGDSFATPNANPDLNYPGFPETQLKLLAIARRGAWTLTGGPVWSAAYWQNFDHTLRLPASLVWNATLAWRTDQWEVSLAVDNLTDENYFLGSEPIFAANTLITQAPPRTLRLSVTRKF
jgi:iron complex outermembrane receptor protein